MTTADLPPLSILDLSTVGEGQTTADAIANSTLAVKVAEELDYKRYWVAEHHNMPAVASTSPSVLIAHLAAATNTISLGSGGVMLPNHAALAIAEQFAMLEAMHPGRIDLGLGRAPGTDGRTALALRRGVRDDRPDEFPSQLLLLMAMLGDDRTGGGGPDKPLNATPNATSYPNIMLLGSSTFSAQLAGTLGLPFAFAEHFSAEYLDAAVDAYNVSFQPSVVLDQPYLIIATSALAAETDSEAMRLSMPGRLMTVGLRKRELRPLMTVEAANEHPDKELAMELTASRIAGSVDTVHKSLQLLTERTGASELMVTSITYGIEERLQSMRLLASR